MSDHIFSGRSRPGRESGSFRDWRTSFDQLVLWLYASGPLRRIVRRQRKTNLEVLWTQTVHCLELRHDEATRRTLNPLEVHEHIVKGLPGEALFLASAMAFDSMSEALEVFEVSSKTAKQRLGERLSAGEGEIALRIGRVVTMAGEALGSLEAGRKYLATPNFALGGAVPRELLKTAEGEQLVLSELQAQAEGAPV